MVADKLNGPHRQQGQFEARASRTPNGRTIIRFRRRDGRAEVSWALNPDDARSLAMVLSRAIDDLAAVGGDRG